MIKQVWAAAIYTQDMWHLLGASVSRKNHSMDLSVQFYCLF